MTKLKLHIGGEEPHPDWKILDIEKRPEVDFVCDASNLSQFEENSIDAIYASHVLEHFYYYINDELENVLKEWYRVLKPDGQLMISVPDMQILCELYTHPNLDSTARFHIMRVIFGGQMNEYDVHKVGFDFDFLHWNLMQAGFRSCQRVSEFNIFKDCSSLSLFGNPISLNVIAIK
jgi:predicted SAM-dependent methyltransferase